MERTQNNCFVLSEHKEKTQYIGLIITVVSVFFILLGNAYKISTAVSYATRILVVYIFLVGAIFAVQTLAHKKNDALSSLFLMLVFLTIVVAAIGGFRTLISHFITYMCFLMLPAYIVSYSKIDYLGNVRKLIFFANFVYATLFIVLSRGSLAHIGYGDYGVYISNDLTLGYGNPNETAIYLLVSFIIMFAGIQSKNGFSKVLHLAYTGILGYLILRTHCRAGIILAIACVVMGLISPFYRVGRKAIRICIYLPLIAAFIGIVNPNLFNSIVVLGETVGSGRYHIYDTYLQGVNVVSLLFGNFSTYAGSNLHNSFLTVFSMFGLPATIVYFKFLYKSIDYFSLHINDNVSYIGLIGVLCLILHGIVEGTLLVAGTVYAGLFSLLILLMIPEGASELGD